VIAEKIDNARVQPLTNVTGQHDQPDASQRCVYRLWFRQDRLFALAWCVPFAKI
jgi:hypothetical protein